MTGALFLEQELKNTETPQSVRKHVYWIICKKVYVGIDSWLILKSPKRLPKRRWDATSVLKYIKKYIEKKKSFLE